MWRVPSLTRYKGANTSHADAWILRSSFCKTRRICSTSRALRFKYLMSSCAEHDSYGATPRYIYSVNNSKKKYDMSVSSHFNVIHQNSKQWRSPSSCWLFQFLMPAHVEHFVRCPQIHYNYFLDQLSRRKKFPSPDAWEAAKKNWTISIANYHRQIHSIWIASN